MYKVLAVAVAAFALPLGTAYAQSTPAADPTTGVAATPESEAGAVADAKAVQAATSADIKAGVAVVDQAGAPVGKIESVSAAGAVIATGKARVQIPLASFGKSDKGLVIAMSKSELEAAAASKGS